MYNFIVIIGSTNEKKMIARLDRATSYYDSEKYSLSDSNNTVVIVLAGRKSTIESMEDYLDSKKIDRSGCICVVARNTLECFSLMYKRLYELGYYARKYRGPHTYTVCTDMNHAPRALLNALDVFRAHGKVQTVCAKNTGSLSMSEQGAILNTAEHLFKKYSTPVSKQVECIIVLGNSNANVRVHRASKAIERFKVRALDEANYTMIMFSGTHGESEYMRDYAVANGIPSDMCVCESKSLNTIQNLEYCRELMSGYFSSNICYTICTDRYHCARSLILTLSSFSNIEPNSSISIIAVESGEDRDETKLILRTACYLVNKHSV